MAIMRNEGLYVREWIEHYLALGADEIVIYDNQSTDATGFIARCARVLFPQVRYKKWPNVYGRVPQRTAYLDALKRCRTEWIAFFDADEFLQIEDGDNIQDYLLRLPAECGAVAVNWLVFGANGEEQARPEPVRERFVRCATRDHPINRMFKTIARVSQVETVFIHHIALRGGHYTDAKGRLIDTTTQRRDAATDHVCTEGAMLHHYVVKSREEFNIKATRPDAAVRVGIGKTDRGDPVKRFDRMNYNEVEDDSLCTFSKETRIGVRLKLLRYFVFRAERNALASIASSAPISPTVPERGRPHRRRRPTPRRSPPRAGLEDEVGGGDGGGVG